MANKTLDELMTANSEYKSKLKTLQEEWKQIDVFDIAPIYKISNIGHVRTVENDTRIFSNNNSDGYEVVTLKNKSGKNKEYLVHKIVAIKFVNIPQDLADQGYTADKLYIKHINDIKYHNAVFNLEWRKPNDITDEQKKIIHEICRYLEQGKSNEFIKEKTGASDNTIYDLARNRIHKDITSQYKINHRTNDLSNEEIHTICKEIISKEQGVHKIAKNHGVSADYLYSLIKGEYRTDITSQYPALKNSITTRLSDDEIREICQEIKDEKLSIAEIAQKHGKSVDYIKSIKYGRRCRNISKDYF